MAIKGTLKEMRAIREYAEAHDLVPQLSDLANAQIYFKNREGEEVKVSYLAITKELEQDAKKRKEQ
jgi:hypothetical protein